MRSWSLTVHSFYSCFMCDVRVFMCVIGCGCDRAVFIVRVFLLLLSPFVLAHILCAPCVWVCTRRCALLCFMYSIKRLFLSWLFMLFFHLVFVYLFLFYTPARSLTRAPCVCLCRWFVFVTHCCWITLKTNNNNNSSTNNMWEACISIAVSEIVRVLFMGAHCNDFDKIMCWSWVWCGCCYFW